MVKMPKFIRKLYRCKSAKRGELVPNEIIFEELGKNERILLLRAFDYDVDDDGYIKFPSGQRIKSKEIPGKFIHIDEAALLPGTLEVVEGTAPALSKFIREKMER